jgi:hypothetical protein
MTSNPAKPPHTSSSDLPSKFALQEQMAQLHLELWAIENRLGSASALPADVERARELAHKLKNVYTALSLWNDLENAGTDPVATD